MVFFPLGRLFDPSVGGTPHGSLASEVVLGFIGGLVISPVGAVFGALVGRRLLFRPLRAIEVLALMFLPAAIGIGLFVVVNGGLIDEGESTDSVQFVLALSALSWLVGVVCYSVARLLLVRSPSSDDLSGAT